MQNFDAYSRLAVRLACRNLIRHYAKSLLSARRLDWRQEYRR